MQLMRSLKVGAILCSFCGLVSCASTQSATSPLASPTHFSPPPELAAQTPRKLPKWHYSFSAGDPYPDQARYQNLVGRVLIEFQIDRNGRAVSPKLLAADADAVLQSGALTLLEKSTFDVGDLDLTDPTPFRVTVRYCLPKCEGIPLFPGTEELTITGSPLRR